MSGHDSQLGTALHDLRERTKELNCIYQVNDLLSSAERPLDEVLQGIVGLLPPAWQYPEECQAQIVYRICASHAGLPNPPPGQPPASAVEGRRWAASRCRTGTRCRPRMKGRS
jgi:hypothetical protein